MKSEYVFQFRVRVEAHATEANSIQCSVWTGGVKHVTINYVPDTWLSLIVHADATNISVWIDNAGLQQTASGGALDTNANNVAIFATNSGANNVKIVSLFAFLTIGDKDIITDSAWRTAYQALTLDWEDATAEEITTSPERKHIGAEPNSHVGVVWL